MQTSFTSYNIQGYNYKALIIILITLEVHCISSAVHQPQLSDSVDKCVPNAEWLPISYWITPIHTANERLSLKKYVGAIFQVSSALWEHLVEVNHK